ncbi:cation diffusion facilitator family transporter [Parasporobacterium paucivorans]|uniref:Cation diffusion facilitator family transporter n=1 Tax=Parasporobacterium paucivorans DSM 15970 TaxID=1122934 RepID=A0A1M6DLW6_9FIRM|nr:cation diffusion facilitator family transporter [Parasporobacterium paucivorans]SHI74059.1 cation diffusion facilitator family transporter [Parasporobacterium paucivorans DSM 15970]
MTGLLVKLFIRNHDEVQNSDVRTAYGMLAGMVGIICNILLFAVKLFIGIFINSISVMADAFNNLSDSASSVVGVMGAKLAGRSPDKEHPFGHGRIEYISALIVAFLILYVGITLLKTSFAKVIHPEKLGFNWVIVLVLCISALVKVWLSLFNRMLGDRINSNVLKATSTDARNDVVVTSVTILSIVFEKISGITIDGWAGLAVSIFVLFSGFNIARETLMPLLGEAVDKDVSERIIRKVESYEGILGTHDLIAHNYGPSRIMATIHAEVPNNMDMEDIHDVVDCIERDVLREQGIFLVIHMDPVEVQDQKYMERKDMVGHLIQGLEPEATIHDFRAVERDMNIKFVFDLVVPHSFSETDKEELVENITVGLLGTHPGCCCVITIENSFMAE